MWDTVSQAFWKSILTTTTDVSVASDIDQSLHDSNKQLIQEWFFKNAMLTFIYEFTIVKVIEQIRNNDWFQQFATDACQNNRSIVAQFWRITLLENWGNNRPLPVWGEHMQVDDTSKKEYVMEKQCSQSCFWKSKQIVHLDQPLWRILISK